MAIGKKTAPTIAITMGDPAGIGPEIAGTPVVHEEQPLSEPPERRGSELVRLRGPLVGAVGQRRTHVVDREVREWVVGDAGEGGDRFEEKW